VFGIGPTTAPSFCQRPPHASSCRHWPCKGPMNLVDWGASNKTGDDLEWPSSETCGRGFPELFRKRLQACVFEAGGHFEHSMWL